MGLGELLDWPDLDVVDRLGVQPGGYLILFVDVGDLRAQLERFLVPGGLRGRVDWLLSLNLDVEVMN